MEPQFARTVASDGVSISWSSVGDGPAFVYLPSAPFSDTTAEWSIPVLRRAFEGLARRLRLVQFDARGTGRSQRDVSDVSLEAMLDDLSSVVAAAGLERFAILGTYSAVTHAIAAAARWPDAVTHLVLFGGAARGFVPMSGQATQALLSLIERDWDTFVESAAHAWLGWPDREQGRLAANWFRSATSAANARATFQAASAVDVTADCARVRCPALVLHRIGAPPVSLATAAELADSLPRGRLEVIPGTSASLFFEDAELLAAAIADFVAGPPSGRPRAAAAGRATGTTGRAGLTAREVEVLRLVAAGESNAEIAGRLGVTINTVERHLVNVYRKIDARGRADATAYAIRSGLA
jgi:pimeloyl-ACP methyl ester carboxylesterase/DNA-binding CsgD family transcriptional regulator